MDMAEREYVVRTSFEKNAGKHFLTRMLLSRPEGVMHRDVHHLSLCQVCRGSCVLLNPCFSEGGFFYGYGGEAGPDENQFRLNLSGTNLNIVIAFYRYGPKGERRNSANKKESIF